MNEINVDCWNTTKGETQTTVYFRPIEEFRASAISKLTRSHVISDNFGFDANISLGSLTLNIQHKLTNNDSDQVNKDDNKVLDSHDIASIIADDLLENKLIESELNKNVNLPNANNIGNNSIKNNNSSESLNDDASLHKFLNVQFNQMVNCEICNKKVNFLKTEQNQQFGSNYQVFAEFSIRM